MYLIRDILTGESRRYAFIEFEHSSEVESALEAGADMVIDGKTVLVDRECGRTVKGWKPRRFGGGFGGERASGQQRFGGRYSMERDDRRRSPYINGRDIRRSSRGPYRPRQDRSSLDRFANGSGRRYEPNSNIRGGRNIGGYDDGNRLRMRGYNSGRPSPPPPAYGRDRRMDRR